MYESTWKSDQVVGEGRWWRIMCWKARATTYINAGKIFVCFFSQGKGKEDQMCSEAKEAAKHMQTLRPTIP